MTRRIILKQVEYTVLSVAQPTVKGRLKQCGFRDYIKSEGFYLPSYLKDTLTLAL